MLSIVIFAFVHLIIRTIRPVVDSCNSQHIFVIEIYYCLLHSVSRSLSHTMYLHSLRIPSCCCPDNRLYSHVSFLWYQPTEKQRPHRYFPSFGTIGTWTKVWEAHLRQKSSIGATTHLDLTRCIGTCLGTDTTTTSEERMK